MSKAYVTLREINTGLASISEETRWAAAHAATDFIDKSPMETWHLVVTHGSSADEDTRMAVATCILEHLLEKHFDTFFPLLEQEIDSGNANLGDTLNLCWKLGDAMNTSNAKRWDMLIAKWKKSVRRASS